MIIFILLILAIIGLIAFYIYKTEILTKEHLDEVQDYLNEIAARDEKIRKYKETITEKKTKLQEENEEIGNLNKEIENLKNKLSLTIKENKSRIDDLTLQLETKDKLLIKENKKNAELVRKIKEKEDLRRKSAGSAGGLKTEINKLKKELEKAKYTIDFYKKHRKTPTEEEIKAYDYQFKAVEKRQKEK